uniref:17-beta-hydroxysteroid dehydrogenase type 6 n=1 Tax=Anisakis simplex TaxID=6269 RepID=A0A0M3J6W4_ANISI
LLKRIKNIDAFIHVKFISHFLSLEVNTLGHIRVTKAFKPLLKQSKGRIVTATSIAGRIALPYAAPYSVAKFACEAYMDCVRQEVQPWGVTVSIVEPGVFKTPIVDRSGMKNRIEGVWSKMTDEQKAEYGEDFKNYFAIHWSDTFYNLGSPHIEWVIDDYYHAVTAMFPRNRYRVGWDAYLIFIPCTFLPTMLVDAINAYLLAPTKMKPASLEKAKQS